MMIGFQAQAGDFAYLTFEMTDGTKASISVEGLTITVSGTTLTTGGQNFEISNLNKMYFSSGDETTGIGQVSSDQFDAQAEIYDLQGRKLTKEQMKNGVYLVKEKDETYKIVVR